MSVRSRRGGGEVPDVSEMDPWKDDRCRDFIALNTIQRLRAYHLPHSAAMPEVEAVNTVRARNLLLLPRATPDYRPCQGETASHNEKDEEEENTISNEQHGDGSARGCCAIEQARVLYFGPSSFVSSVSPRQLVNSPHYASPSATPSQPVTLPHTPARPPVQPTTQETCLRTNEANTVHNATSSDVEGGVGESGNVVVDNSPSPMHAMPRQSNVDDTPESRTEQVINNNDNEQHGEAVESQREDELASRVLDFGTPIRNATTTTRAEVNDAKTPAVTTANKTTPTTATAAPLLDACRFSCEVTETLIAYFQSLLTRGIVLDRFSHKDLAFAWWVIGCEMQTAALASPILGRREGLLIRLRNYYYSLLSSRKRRGIATASEGEAEEEGDGGQSAVKGATHDVEEDEEEDKTEEVSATRSESEASTTSSAVRHTTSEEKRRGRRRTASQSPSAPDEEEEEEEEEERRAKVHHTPPVVQRTRGRGRGSRGAAIVASSGSVVELGTSKAHAQVKEDTNKSVTSSSTQVVVSSRGRGRGAASASATGRGRGSGAATTAMWHSARLSRRCTITTEQEEEEKKEKEDDKRHEATQDSAKTSVPSTRQRGRGGHHANTTTSSKNTPSMPEEQTIAEMISHIEAHEAATKGTTSSVTTTHKRRRRGLSEEADTAVASATMTSSSSSALVSPVSKRAPAFTSATRSSATEGMTAAPSPPPVVLHPSKLLRHATRRIEHRMSDTSEAFATPLTAYCYRTIMTDAFGTQPDNNATHSSTPIMMASMLRHDQRLCEDMMRRTKHGVLQQDVSQDEEEEDDVSTRQLSEADNDECEDKDIESHSDTHEAHDDALQAKLDTPFTALPFAQQCLLVWEANSLLEAYEARRSAAETRWLRRQARPGMATRRMASQAVQSMPLEAWSDAEDCVLSDSTTSSSSSDEESTSEEDKKEISERDVKAEAKVETGVSNHGYRAIFDYWADARTTLKTDQAH